MSYSDKFTNEEIYKTAAFEFEALYEAFKPEGSTELGRAYDEAGEGDKPDTVALAFGYDLRQHTISEIQQNLVSVGITLSQTQIQAIESLQNNTATASATASALSDLTLTKGQSYQLLGNEFDKKAEDLVNRLKTKKLIHKLLNRALSYG